MGWPPTTSTVCAAEGHRNDRQRGFTAEEVRRLAAIFGISPSQLTTRCANCGGHPPAGYACLACGAAPGSDHQAASAATGRVAGMTGHMDMLRYAAGIGAAGYQPGTAERGLLEQFAADKE
jgi:hypothetical protein